MEGGIVKEKASRYVFNTVDGHLVVNDDAKLACSFFEIDPQSLIQRTLDSFKEDGKVADDIAKIRLQHFEERRKRKIRTIEDVIKYGVLNALKETFPGAISRPGDQRINFSQVGRQNIQTR